jgi:PKD repeat protein
MAQNFSVSRTSGYTNITNFLFNVDDLTDKNYSKYLWDFGDGVRSREKNPSHVFINPSSFNVVLNDL